MHMSTKENGSSGLQIHSDFLLTKIEQVKCFLINFDLIKTWHQHFQLIDYIVTLFALSRLLANWQLWRLLRIVRINQMILDGVCLDCIFFVL